MPGSDSGKKSINTRDETPHVTRHTQGHGAVQAGPGAGCSQCTVGIQPVTPEYQCLQQSLTNSFGKEDAVLKVSKLFRSLSQPVHCSIYDRQLKMLPGIQCRIGI